MKTNKTIQSILTAAFLLASTGCIIDGDDNAFNGVGDEGAFVNVNWELIGGCPPGAAGAVFSYQLNEPGTDVFTDEAVDCQASGMFLSDPLPLGTYSEIFFDIVDANGAVLAQSNVVPNVQLVNPGEVVELPVLEFPSIGGFFELSWSISTNMGAALTCIQAGAASVFLSADLDDGDPETLFDFTFPCQQVEPVLTDVLPIGDYQVDLTLLDPNGTPIGADLSGNGTIAFGNDLHNLGTFDFVPAP